MSDMKETFYVAMRKKDAQYVVEGTVEDVCKDCGDTVVIDKKLHDMAGEMSGILCVPCVTEETGLNVRQLFALNADRMMKLLEERFGDS